MGVGTTLGNDILNFVLKGSYATWISLHTAEPVLGGTTFEVSGTNYARELVNPSDWSVPVSKTSQTAVTLTFATAGSNWGTITHVGIWSASAAGTLLWWGALNAVRTVNTGETLSFSAGNLVGQVA